MKMTVLGVKRVKGISSKTGNDFDMCRLIGMVPVSPTSNSKVTISGHGFEVAEVELDPDSLPQFSTLKFPAQLDLTTDSRPFMGKFETVVTGFLAPVAKAA